MIFIIEHLFTNHDSLFSLKYFVFIITFIFLVAECSLHKNQIACSFALYNVAIRFIKSGIHNIKKYFHLIINFNSVIKIAAILSL
jgi:hypothetical protein